MHPPCGALVLNCCGVVVMIPVCDESVHLWSIDTCFPKIFIGKEDLTHNNEGHLSKMLKFGISYEIGLYHG